MTKIRKPKLQLSLSNLNIDVKDNINIHEIIIIGNKKRNFVKKTNFSFFKIDKTN